MKHRYLQPDGQSIIWHNEACDTAVIWGFAQQEAALSGSVFNVTAGNELSLAALHTLEPLHTYTVKASQLPTLLF